MRVTIIAVGRLKAGPEKSLFDDYRERFDRTGRNLGLGPLSLSEIDTRKGGGPVAEAEQLRSAIPHGAQVVVLDERGKAQSSDQFSDNLARWRDNGCRDLAFLIGGADGTTTDLRASADKLLSFGAMVWPHMLVRVMLAEQLYRAASILSGSPYHRA